MTIYSPGRDNSEQNKTSNTKPLEGIKVVELAQLVAGPYSGKLLADLGADVIKIEHPKRGDASRHYGPFIKDTQHLEKSILFLYLNTNKKSVTLDINDSSALKQLLKLIMWADIFIVDNPPDQLHKLKLTYTELEKINPQLVMTSITPFGHNGPYRDYKAYPLNTFHAGGLGYLSPQTPKGSEQRPVKLGGLFSEYSVGLVAAQGTLAALYAQQSTGIGQLVDISKQEAIMSLCRVQLARYPNEGVIQSRHDERAGSMGITKCKDGHVVMTANQPHEFKAFIKLMGNSEWENDERYLDRNFRALNWNKISQQINNWVKDQCKSELYHKGQQLGCPITPVMSAEDVCISQQLQNRQFFIDIEHPLAGNLKYPGLPYHFSNVTLNQMNPAPLLGQHNITILHSIFVSDKIKAKESTQIKIESDKKREETKLPLQGIRIADFSWMWAGAHATELLSFLGAEVIRIESMKHIDFTRLFSFTTGQKFDKLDESPVFNDINLGKKSIRLNLSKPEGIEIAKKLVGISDIVMQNMRPGVMAKLGLSYEDLEKIKPDIIYLSSSSRGSNGPDFILAMRQILQPGVVFLLLLEHQIVSLHFLQVKSTY